MTVELRSTSCAQHGHREITLQLTEPLPVPGLEQMLMSFFELRVAKGAKFEPGQVVQFGGASLRMVQRADGTLGVEELVPALKATWRESVDRALMTTWTQNEIVRSVGLEAQLSFARDVSTVTACKRVLEEPGVFLSRSAPANEQDSGWFVGCLDASHAHRDAENLEAMVVAKLALVCAPAVQFLALPVGCEVVVRARPGGGRVTAEVALEGKQLAPSPGSYLELLNREP